MSHFVISNKLYHERSIVTLIDVTLILIILENIRTLLTNFQLVIFANVRSTSLTFNRVWYYTLNDYNETKLSI
jgi:hypothetical protein